MDESNVLDSGFLERMNTLLANGEVRELVSVVLCHMVPHRKVRRHTEAVLSPGSWAL